MPMLAVQWMSSSSDLDGRRDGLDELLRHAGHAAVVGEVGQDDDELVAAQARHGVARRAAPAQPVGHLAQQHVAGLVAEAVVDGLEAVEVDEQHGQRLAAALVAGQRLAQAVLHQAAVGQAGEGVVVGRLVELFLLLLVLRDVAGDAVDAQLVAAPRR